MGGIKKFILGNMKYFLSGILLVLIVLILVKCTNEDKKDDSVTDDGEGVVAAEDGQTLAGEEEVPVNDLLQDAYPAVNELVNSYFAAKASGDTEALAATVSELSDTESESVTKMSEHIESYENITCYTKLGPEDNSYVVYVCYDIKFQNVDTVAPSLNMLYVCTAGDGSLYINNGEWDAATEAAIVELNSGDDVQSLVTQVEEAYNAALEQDEKLRNLASTIQSAAETQNDTGEPSDEQGTGDSSQETVYAKETVNVRSQADENSSRVGQIARGDSATRISEDENGWSQITYNNATAYVKSEYLTTNKDEVGTGDTSSSDSPSSGTARIIETAKMRTGEDVSSELIETLYPGTSVEVQEKLSSGRTKISYNGKTGYVNSECLGQ